MRGTLSPASSPRASTFPRILTPVSSRHMPTPVIRPAVPSDAAAISAIYNHSVQFSTATYQEQPESVHDRLAWLAAHGPAHPVLVAEIDGTLAGWASLSPFHPRSAFRHTVESSVYINENFHRRGLARLLMTQLLDQARTLGHHVVLAIISADQDASRQLHHTLGFQQAGHLHEVGRKFDRWLDLVTMEFRL